MRARFLLYCLRAGALQLLLVVVAILLLCQAVLWLQWSAFGFRAAAGDEAAVEESNVLSLSWKVLSGREFRTGIAGAAPQASRDQVAVDGVAPAAADGQSVLSLVLERALNSSWVIALALMAILALGIPVGILRGKSRRNPLAWLLAIPSAVGVCLPVYWMAAVAAWWMLDRHGIPLPGRQSEELAISVVAPDATWLVERWPGFLLAGLIAMAGTGWLVRSVSGGIQHAAKADHLWVGRMRGMRESRLFHRHTLRNSLRPILMSVADLLPFVIGALILGEGVLGYQGLGGLIFDAGLARDFAVLLPATLLLAVVVLGARVVGLMMDGWFDPLAGEEAVSLL